LGVELARHSQLFASMVRFDPANAGIIVTENCNSRCMTCTQWHQKSSNELSLVEILNTLKQLKGLGIKGITFSGGEPLLRKDLSAMVRECSALKFDDITILTNGLLLTPSLAEELLQGGVTTIGISIDGLTDTNDMVRGVKGSFQKNLSVLKMLTNLRDNKYKSLDLYVATTLMKPTLSDIIPLANLLGSMRIKININLIDTSLYFFKIDGADLMIKDQNQLNSVVDELHKLKTKHGDIFHISHTHASFEYIRNYFQDPKRKEVPCISGYTSLDIGAHGEVYSGCLAMEPMGNIREKSLTEILKSAKYKSRLRDMFYKNCPGCSCGYKMNLFYYPPWIREELYWRIKMRRAQLWSRSKREGSDNERQPSTQA
jgi:MoaA/NifB/PqqE/SkfB family radical SAM enzyme